jgi:drug/metabolite transporter (DMT)-like permease
MLTALVLSSRLRRKIGWIGSFGLAIGAVWIVFAAGLGGGQNAAAPGLVFLMVGACALGAWVVVTVRSWLLRVMVEDLTADPRHKLYSLLDV